MFRGAQLNSHRKSVQARESLVLSRCAHHFNKSTIRNPACRLWPISRRAHSNKPAETNAQGKGSQDRRCCFRCQCRRGSVCRGACCCPTAVPACVAQRGHHDDSALERPAERVWTVKWRAEQLVSGVFPRECRGIGLEIGHGCEWEWLLAWILGHLPRHCTFSIV
ncbi:hypothetical protein BCR44DRAFT_1429210 [Catenaria anguillulae PL171]|uniref:Uncharacterized protein n=1 Tax=Catenaria anguillulae PL171 TaxID=765915 RepID=A0A1Y2HPN0_9FUNG|nr:hypothetical protein BCR44DRAFT_1455464 [Catenaria anguillulae PL171]ORZ36489.1 hypothetical protein BCR44DRAFT_1432743 [Catenaria anguillulae PL171]ORZ37902.1 hypothetical protein BCR44DRAFT_1429210 [Catenaria anguillulae PL171]